MAVRSMAIRRKPHYNLIIAQDCDQGPRQLHPVFLFTPDLDDTDLHFHIDLTNAEAMRLYLWLGEHLKSVTKKQKW